MINIIGICDKCGGNVYYDTKKEQCVFSPVDDCICECPYPNDFMEWWENAGEKFNIKDDYKVWQAAQESLVNRAVAFLEGDQ
jgi:hypothetical protein